MEELLRKCYKEAGIVGVNAPLIEHRITAIRKILDDGSFFKENEWTLLTKWTIGVATDVAVEKLLISLEKIFCETDDKYSNENTKELHILVEFLLFQYCTETNNNLLPLIVVCGDGVDWKLHSRQLYAKFLALTNESRVTMRQSDLLVFVDTERRWTPLQEMLVPQTSEAEGETEELTTKEISDQLADIVKILDMQLDDLRQWNRKLAFALSAQREESNILWWMIAEWSETCKKSYQDMSGEEAAVFSAYELSENISFSLGPYASREILSKMVSLSKVKAHESISIATYIDRLNGTLLPSFEKYEITDMQPILSALCAKKAALKKGNEDTWRQHYEIDEKILDHILLTAVGFGQQLYLEFELGRQLRTSGGGVA